MPSFPAPAKINLFLHVTGRRADGYHELQSAFQFIDLEDTVHLAITDNGEISRSRGLDGVAPADDLAVRAAVALQTYTNTSRGVRIDIEKRIPAGAGLGGGSSDAATVLVALNRLWDLGLDRADLAGIGLDLGADVPVFVRGFGAFAEGVGERLQPLDYPDSVGVLVVPDVHVPTATVFADPGLTRNTPAIRIRALRDAALRNDLEPVATRLFPAVAEARARLQDALDAVCSGTPLISARMTGSGGAVFALIGAGEQDLDTAQQVREHVSEAGGGAWRLVRTIATSNCHPLSDERI